MLDLEQCVAELSEAVWAQTLGLPLERVGEAPTFREPIIVGQVQASGDWQGRVTVQCSLAAAQRAAHIMFSTQTAPDSPQDILDAVGELANMIGGNVKALMSNEGCVLSLPMVTENEGYALVHPDWTIVTRQAFASVGEHVVVTLLEPALG